MTRQTVSAWLHHHSGFQAALNGRRRELWNGLTDTLRGLLPTALEVLKCALEGETPLPAAVHPGWEVWGNQTDDYYPTWSTYANHSQASSR